MACEVKTLVLGGIGTENFPGTAEPTEVSLHAEKFWANLGPNHQGTPRDKRLN